jgi:hypothetical protein
MKASVAIGFTQPWALERDLVVELVLEIAGSLQRLHCGRRLGADAHPGLVGKFFVTFTADDLAVDGGDRGSDPLVADIGSAESPFENVMDE